MMINACVCNLMLFITKHMGTYFSEFPEMPIFDGIFFVNAGISYRPITRLKKTKFIFHLNKSEQM